jgi:hypothetical protein
MAGREVQGEREIAENLDQLPMSALLGHRRLPAQFAPQLTESRPLVEGRQRDRMPAQSAPEILQAAGHDHRRARQLKEEAARRNLGGGRVDVFDVQQGSWVAKPLPHTVRDLVASRNVETVG